MGCVYAYVILLTAIGPEYRGRDFDAAADEDLAIATGADAGKYETKKQVEDLESRPHA
jgi:SHS family lactate transporter-like MFS transporter